jgi:hypothetical protein
MGKVEIPVDAVEHNDVEVRILLDEATRSLSSATVVPVIVLIRRVVERHMAVSGGTAINPEVRPGSVGFNRTHVELRRWIGIILLSLRGMLAGYPSPSEASLASL